eukprot:CAMPEP_0175429972 /NCGR_PEP_ID=MMETSP0095-20121207/51629_1 /TAXON_ID=311494 /ORGANISM="Alexandrium monilatum, Strain CCMP3105" /LENGTH=85 /DNA_ID=CAMNT_0016729429 /DNA_START=59 /DNA_END=316 /DNA_ORIENTATION=+
MCAILRHGQRSPSGGSALGWAFCTSAWQGWFVAPACAGPVAGTLAAGSPLTGSQSVSNRGDILAVGSCDRTEIGRAVSASARDVM